MEKEGRVLVKRHAFGARSDTHNTLNWVDDEMLMYSVGKSVVLHHLPSNNQRFLEASVSSALGITALAVSDNKKFLAIAEGGKNPQVQIIDTVTRKRRKLLSVAGRDLGSDRFVAITFSMDGRHLVTQGGGPSWNLYYWNWERSKPLAMVSLGCVENEQQLSSKGSGASNEARGRSKNFFSKANMVTEVAICPTDSLTITVSGIGLLRFYRYMDSLLQPLPSCGVPHESNEIFVTHRWVDKDCVVASTQQGALMLIEQGRYVCHVAVPPKRPIGAASFMNSVTNTRRPVITVICPTKNGFVTGNDHGVLCKYTCTRKEEGEEDEAVNRASAALPTYYVPQGIICVPEREPGEPLIKSGDRNLSSNNAVLGGVGGGGGAATQLSESAPATSSFGRAGTNPLKQKSHGNANLDTGAMVSITSKHKFKLTSVSTTGVVPCIPDAPPERAMKVAFEDLVTDPDGARSDREGGDVPVAKPTATTPVATLASQRSHDGGGNPSGVPGGISADPSGEAAAGVSVMLGHGVAALALDPLETRLAMLTRAGRIYAVNFAQNWCSPTFTAESGADGLAPLFETVCQPFHTGAINGMDCSVRKPFLITSSSDHSVRIWNTVTNKLEIVQYFSQEPGAVAIHPNGLMAVICFPDKIRVMSILWNSLRERKVITFRQSTDVSFSLGGQYFAVAHSNLVDIFNSLTCESSGQLRGHPQRIKDLKWGSTSPYPTDSRLVTCAMDGMIMDWNILEMRKESEHTEKRFRYVAVAADERNVWAVVAPTSATALDVQWKVTLREMDRAMLSNAAGGIGNGNATEDYEFTDTALTVLRAAPHQRMLFGGGEDGSLKVMTLPLQVGIQEPPLTAHSNRVTRVVLSFDESTLFTASEDGSLLVWDICEEEKVARRMAALEPGDGMNAGKDEVLVTQQEMDENRIEVESLQQQIEMLKTDIDSEERRENHEQGTRIRERCEEYKNETTTLSMEYAQLWNSKAEQERTFVSIKVEKGVEAAQKLEVLERAGQAEVQRLESVCNELQVAVGKEELEHAAKLAELEENLNLESREEDEQYQEMLKQRCEALEKLKVQVERSNQSNTEAILQLELDTDAEVQAVTAKHHTDLKKLRERFLHMKGEGAIMRKNAVLIAKEAGVRNSEIALLDGAMVTLTAQLKDLHHRVGQLRQDIDERDAVIGEKEKSIYTLKKENQELEKHKFVLDHRIRQLKAQMEPKQREMFQHNQRIKLKNNELEELYTCNLTLQENIEELKSDIVEQQQHIKHIHNRIKDFETYQMRLQRDVGEIVTVLQEPQKLREKIEHMYQTYVVDRGGERVAAVDPHIRTEFQNHLGFLSTSAGALQRKVRVEQEHHKKEMAAMMMENLSLIHEIQSLRAEIQELWTLVASKEAALRVRGGTSGDGRSTQRQHLLHSSQSLAEKQKSRRQPTPRPPRCPTPSTLQGGSVAASVCDLSKRNKATGTSSSPGGGDSTLPTAEGILMRIGDTNSKAVSASRRMPSPPAVLERTRTELRMLRAYIEAMNTALADALLPKKPAPAASLPA